MKWVSASIRSLDQVGRSLDPELGPYTGTSDPKQPDDPHEVHWLPSVTFCHGKPVALNLRFTARLGFPRNVVAITYVPPKALLEIHLPLFGCNDCLRRVA